MTIRPPQHIAWLVQRVGQDDALQFIECAAGRRLFVPATAGGSRLAALYGDAIAEALSAQYGGEKYEVPSCREWRVRLYAQMGLTNDEMAQRAGVSYSGVVKILLRAQTVSERAARGNRSSHPDQLHLF
ncbi:hypothetical protein JUN65_01965 [Gluconacetobacter azotocaptans]|uniref:hypothetical protein n=1 Tax=Gluconacetobacter azotocaptans TaxID=142834 RepID=UPI001956CC5C|nr:hypothetical protein [Gluconacetobacter azotocaptans]MBM9400359.1 hypothetical protein [Gluconacetobacter azotocaptans]